MIHRRASHNSAVLTAVIRRFAIFIWVKKRCLYTYRCFAIIKIYYVSITNELGHDYFRQWLCKEQTCTDCVQYRLR